MLKKKSRYFTSGLTKENSSPLTAGAPGLRAMVRAAPGGLSPRHGRPTCAPRAPEHEPRHGGSASRGEPGAARAERRGPAHARNALRP